MSTLQTIEKMRLSPITIFFILLGLLCCAATAFNPTLANSGWFYSKAAYCPLAFIEAWNCEACPGNPGLINISTFHDETTGAQAFTGYDPAANQIVLAFRGSNDIQNWIYDLTFVMVAYPNPNCANCEVHQGFLDVYNAVKNGVLSAMTNLCVFYQPAKPTILITGHSLGGAVAILAAADVTIDLQMHVDGITVITFGEPRVGNPAWVSWMSNQVLQGAVQYRVTHEADPVPQVPPQVFGFLHVPHEVWYNNDDNGYHFVDCADSAATEDMTNCENSQLFTNILDHLYYMGILYGCNPGVKQQRVNGTK